MVLSNPYHYTNQINDYEKVRRLDLLLVEKLKSTQKNNRYVSIVKKLDGGRNFGGLDGIPPELFNNLK